MKKMQKILITALCFTFMISMLTGCKKEQAPKTEEGSGIRVEDSALEEISETDTESESEIDAAVLENEGDIVIVIPEEQEDAGE